MRATLVALTVMGCGRHGFGSNDAPTASDSGADIGDASELRDAPTADDAALDAAVMSIFRRIAMASDDAEEFQDGSVYIDSSDLELCDDVYLNEYGQTVGLRFTSVQIPPGATIVSAVIQFTTDSVETGPGGMQTIRAQADATALTFASSTQDISGRPRTQASVVWMPPRWTAIGAAGAEQRTPNLAAIVQEVVALPAWTQGSELAFIITGSGTNHATPYDTNTATAPLLEIMFSQ